MAPVAWMARKEKKKVRRSARHVSAIGIEYWMRITRQVRMRTLMRPGSHIHIFT